MSRLTIRIDFDGAAKLGHGKVRLLEMIALHGSISKAAEASGMSYRRAWLLVDEVNRSFAEPAVTSQPGGKGGGGAQLTEFGRALIELYRGIEADANRVLAKRLLAFGTQLQPRRDG
jgi:molybdate transport system regulatory protein